MKKGKITITIWTAIVVLIFTAVLFIQFKTINQTDILSIENMREDELKSEISNFKQKSEELKKELQETNTKIQEYKDAIASGNEASELLEKELEEQNNILGKNQVTGTGVVVTLKDTNTKKINAEDLRLLLNELKMAGAEAISINDERIVYDSYIVDIGGTYISVNGTRIVSPYEVKAIGNQAYLESGLSKKQYGYIDTKLEEGKEVLLERKDNITIEKYKNSLDMEYAN